MARRLRALELIAGIGTDPVSGPVVLFGHGGIAVEVTADQAIGLPPLNRVLAADLACRRWRARSGSTWPRRQTAWWRCGAGWTPHRHQAKW